MLKSLKLLHPTTELPSKTGTPPDCPVPGCPVASTFASEVRLVTHLRNRHHPISEDLASVTWAFGSARRATSTTWASLMRRHADPDPGLQRRLLPAAAGGPSAANLFSRPR